MAKTTERTGPRLRWMNRDCSLSLGLFFLHSVVFRLAYHTGSFVHIGTGIIAPLAEIKTLRSLPDGLLRLCNSFLGLRNFLR